MSEHDPAAETPPDAHLEDAWEEATGGDDDPVIPDTADAEEGDDEEDPAFAAWLLRLEDDIEEQRFARADQFDAGWRF